MIYRILLWPFCTQAAGMGQWAEVKYIKSAHKYHKRLHSFDSWVDNVDMFMDFIHLICQFHWHLSVPLTSSIWSVSAIHLTPGLITSTCLWTSSIWSVSAIGHVLHIRIWCHIYIILPQVTLYVTKLHCWDYTVPICFLHKLHHISSEFDDKMSHVLRCTSILAILC